MLNTMVQFLLVHPSKISLLFMIPDLLIYGFHLHNANYLQDVYFTQDIIQANLQLINQMVQLFQLNMDQEEYQDFGPTIMLILLELMHQMFNLVKLLKNRALHSLLLNLMEFQVWHGLKLLNANVLLYSKLYGLKV